MSFRHLILFDRYCLLCRKAVLYILIKDQRKQFCFAPLDGKIASKYPHLPKDTLILIKNYQSDPKQYVRSQAVFQIFWMLGKMEKCLSLLFCIPWFADLMYRQVAKKRHTLLKGNKKAFPQKYQNRFKD